MRQAGIPVAVPLPELQRKTSLGQVITLTYDLAGLCPKQVAAEGGFDKSQLSRWESGQEGIVWPKLAGLMDLCGNDAPVLWQLHQRGYDLGSVRKRESELERELRQVREERDALRRVLQGAGA